MSRTLNPLQARYFFEKYNIQPKNDIYSDSIWTKSKLVVTKRRQKFSKNSDVLQLRRKVSFGTAFYLNASVKTHGY